MRRLLLVASSALAIAVAAAPAGAATVRPPTTSYATIGGDAQAPYSRLRLLPGWRRVVRDDLGAEPRAGRHDRRRSLTSPSSRTSSSPTRSRRPARRRSTSPAPRSLLLASPNVIAYVAGHTHENRITAFRRPGGGGFWGIETASEIDRPILSRLLEIMDNGDGTLSIFGTLIDHGAPVVTPPTGTAAGGFDPPTLAALAREFAYNDPQAGVDNGAEGHPQDRNVELLVADPRATRRAP